MFCFELARSGFDIVLVSRTASKLEKVASELKKEYPGIKTKCIAFDFSTLETEDSVKVLTDLVEGITEDVSVLVNNVGVSLYGDFDK